MGKGSVWHSYVHHGRSRFGERVCGLIFCLLCTGPILSIIGLYFLVGSLTDTRTPNIHQFNDAVGRWVEGGGHATLQNGTTGTNLWVQMTRVGLPFRKLDANTREAMIIDDRSAVRPRQYPDNVLRYTTGNVLVNFSGVCNWATGCDTSTRDLEIFIGSGSTSSVVRLPLFREFSRQRKDHSGECNIGDYWDRLDRACVRYSILSSVCVKLQNTSRTGTWRVDASQGGEGCGESAGFRPGNYAVFSWSDTRLPTTWQISITIRSTDDPRVQFYFIMGAGSALDFGLTQAQKFMVGAVLLGIGGVATLAVFSCVCCIAKGVNAATAPSGGYQPMPAVPTATFVAQPVYQQPVYQQPGGYQPYQQPPVYGQPQQPVYQGQPAFGAYGAPGR